MITVKRPYFPYNLILWIFKKVSKAERVAMIDPIFKNVMTLAAYEVDEETYAHEQRHLEQVERDGRFKFIFKYLWYNIRYGYENNPYEVEARGETAES